MTPTEQDKELRAKLAKTKTFNYDIYFGQDIANNCIPFEEALDEIMQLITADRKRVAFEARIDELNRLMEYTDENEIVCVCEQASVQVCDHNWSLCHKARERIAELREKVGNK